ncbi:cupin domain-containing protein [Deinococcus peraridilitoris]|uniref:Mannose-6-phosphate isomerase n=1 Tax=Deinococcus peraridilitoris (strain DSM 19664 / LMG 22246 / CIP 109416 / KR-200) TaxID=937777 RepID=L0A2F6_DEIPD|nr:cupin domain-containing protein [Deinococcus peraridilitoris]AFZ68078.1 mannose-6-phosphate isomerase [Deinococcus peraridilitoris DSM 19664]
MEPLRKVSLAEKFALFDDAWNPRVVGAWDGQQVKLAKFRGEFIWHHHEHEDEVFFVVRGAVRMGLRDPEERDMLLQEGELLIVPRGVEHKPAAEGEEAWVMMLESAGTLNTGNVRGERTRDTLERI